MHLAATIRGADIGSPFAGSVPPPQDWLPQAPRRICKIYFTLQRKHRPRTGDACWLALRRGHRRCVGLRRRLRPRLARFAIAPARLGYSSFIHDHVIRDEPAARRAVDHLEIVRVPWPEGFAIFDLADA